MANDAHHQLRGAHEPSLERLFSELAEVIARLEAHEAHLCEVEGRLDAEDEHHAQIEQAAKDAIGLALALQETERPVTADGVSGDWAPVSPGRPKLRVILGGLAVTVAAAFAPAASAAAHHPAHHVTAAHSRRARDVDPAGERMDG